MSAFLREERHNHESPHSSNGRQARPSTNFSSTPHELGTDSNSPAHTVARQDIRASAEKILYTFLLPGAEREITLPGSITQDVTTAIEEYGRDDPEVFDVAKDYVFQAMERDAFPGFLRMKALGNLIPPTLIMRLILGLVSMFGGFWAAFILIFLDETRLTRIWVCYTASFHTISFSGTDHSNSLSCHSPLAFTAWRHINIPLIQFSPLLDLASTPLSTSLECENPMSGSSLLDEPSWCSP